MPDMDTCRLQAETFPLRESGNRQERLEAANGSRMNVFPPEFQMSLAGM
jgi:hypothetical protein